MCGWLSGVPSKVAYGHLCTFARTWLCRRTCTPTVGFGDVVVRLRGEPVTCVLFAFRMSYSGKAVHRIFASGGQEAFFEGHVHALGVLGGVPAGKVRYDNLKAAVAQVLGFTRARVENERWTAFRSHFDLEAFYCQPGIGGAHEKGGVEGQVECVSRNHLVPVPQVESLAELNAMVEQWDLDDDARRVGARPRTIGEHFAVEVHRCSSPCRASRSRPAAGSPPGSTATARSTSALTATPCPSG